MDSYEDLLGSPCTLIEQDRIASFELTGADRVRFLQGRITSDVAAPAVGHGIYGFFPQIKGRILADASVLAEDERLVVELPAERCETIIEHLSKYILIDQVEIRPLEEASFAVLGSAAAAVLGVDLPVQTRQHLSIKIHGTPCRLLRLPDLGVPTFGVRTASADAAKLRSSLEDAGAVLAGSKVWEHLHTLSGRPLFGRDFDEKNFPQELEPWYPGDEDAVSYTKGCYLGQEVIARIHYRGGVNKHLRGILLDGDSTADLAGTEVLHDGRAAGTVTASAKAGERRLALAMLHSRVEPGATVDVGGAAGEVIARPFGEL